MANLEFDPNLFTSDRVLSALREARAKLEKIDQEKRERVAIIGMAGQFPGAETVEQFWQNLCDGVHAIEILPQDADRPHYVNAYSSFSNIAGFDADFFGYSPREAELMDPQHRVFLECAWAALENAGYVSERYDGAIGVYAGAALNSYLINLYTNPHLRQSVDRVQAVISNVMGLMPTRVSYKLNLRGPSCGIQTGCSTSLVAVHLAVQSLLNRECDLALAGGVAIDTSAAKGYAYQNDGVMSPDGYCRAFDANAKGTVFGNGVGIVVLKRLSEALADRDYIYAVIKGSAVNNDGAQKVGLTAPSVAGQAAVIATALDKAAVDPATIQYIETHGTGTALGDPIEIAALTKAFRQHTPQRQFCAIGSVKTNIGHLDAAAGITGLIKTALAIKHQQLPPSLNFQTPNPQIDFAHSPFYVNTTLTHWSDPLRRAAVSSFGMGGTNAHLILESVPAPTTTDSRSHQLLLLSAKTPTALAAAIAQLADYFQRHPSLNLADVAYTLQIGRASFDYRYAFVCQTVDEAIHQLRAFNDKFDLTLDAHPHPSLITDRSSPTIAFLFPGQGSQYPNMGRDL
ncbi:MAG: type I polyketide synthase, partial [Synechococcales cyanobacterium M58_A2018_015]|nr:type I polyketide synthase [Synechococcales cyanobacterium M58_A2018_015]